MAPESGIRFCRSRVRPSPLGRMACLSKFITSQTERSPMACSPSSLKSSPNSPPKCAKLPQSSTEPSTDYPTKYSSPGSIATEGSLLVRVGFYDVCRLRGSVTRIGTLPEQFSGFLLDWHAIRRMLKLSRQTTGASCVVEAYPPNGREHQQRPGRSR